MWRHTSIMAAVAVATTMISGCASQGTSKMDKVAKNRPAIEQNELKQLLDETPGKFNAVLADAKTLRAQVLFSEIEPDGSIKRHGYRLDEEYFYPASTIKAFASVAALQYVHELNERDGVKLKPQTPMAIHPLFADESYQYDDASNLIQGKKTIEHEIRRTLLVSSNSAFNHLFEFVGQQRINEMAAEAGLDQTFYMHRLAEFRSVEENQTTPQIDFHFPDGYIYTVPQRKSELVFDNDDLAGVKIGIGYQNDDGTITDGPLDFKHKNRCSLRDLQDILIKIARPDVDLGTPGFKLTEEDRAILISALTQHPRESKSPKYTKEDLGDWIADSQFVPGLLRVDSNRDHWLVYEKTGTAWAFSIENAVIVYKPTGKTFALSAAMYTNKRNILNTDDYEYKFADAFFEDLGEVIARKMLSK